jgi:predicted O-methyltransferase YrrM
MKTVAELVAFSSGVDGQGIEDHPNCTCTKAELRALANQLVHLKQGARVVEIGVFTGRSASLYFQLQAALNLELHLIDNWSWNANHATMMFDKLVIENFNEVPFTLHKMRSDYLGDQRWFLPIDFLYIDGWHDQPGIEPDCLLWLPWVKPGGIAAFHDSDYICVRDCLSKYVAPLWSMCEEAERMTTWRKPYGIEKR